MKFLAIEPIGSGGHRDFNTFFLRCLGTIGRVTFVASTGDLESCAVDSRIDIPAPLFRHDTKLGARRSGIRVLDYIINNINLDEYDAIVFLSYETISFSLRWPKYRKVLLFEHNNIENAYGSRIKTFFYRRLCPNAIHLVFQPHIARYIRDMFGRSVVHVPHPYYRRDVSYSGIYPNTVEPQRSKDRTLIFSPSASTPSLIQDELKTFVSTAKGAYYAVLKGKHSEKTDAWEVCPFFDNYEDLMRSCDLVFLGARFDYRVSGVAYEALSFGKPIVLLDCLFARELKEKYPNMVIVVNGLNDILDVNIDTEQMRDDHRRFLRDHAFDSIRADMIHALSVGNIVVKEGEKNY